MNKEITCIICPISCQIIIEHRDGTIKSIEGFQCEKGKVYAEEELLSPVRALTTTIMVKDGVLPLVSVKTNKPVPKEKLFKVMDAISGVEVDAPVNIGDVLVENVFDLNIDIVATKNVERGEG
ncbi:MAG: DUF1667 domain-containing protein [Thermoplasmata archaeon]